MKERREFHRWDCVMPCRCEGNDLRLNGTIGDLSYGGAGIASWKKLPIEGAEFVLTIRPTRERIKLRSRAVWLAPEAEELGHVEFGVEFCETLEERREKLAGLLPEHRSPAF